MRTTKTLLIAATALAATVTASNAQTVYSQNVVGYINLSVTNNTLAMCANQLDTGSNTLNNVFQTGAISGKTQILEWNGFGYNTYEYENSSLSGSGTGWFNIANGVNAGATNYAQPGYGFFIKEAAGANVTIPTVGQVIQGTNVYMVPVGLNMYSLPEALAGQPLDSTNINFPAVSGKIQYETWNGTGFNTYEYENSSLSGSGTGYFNIANGQYVDNIAADQPIAGGSFFIRNATSQTLFWTNVFEVQ